MIYVEVQIESDNCRRVAGRESTDSDRHEGVRAGLLGVGEPHKQLQHTARNALRRHLDPLVAYELHRVRIVRVCTRNPLTGSFQFASGATKSDEERSDEV